MTIPWFEDQNESYQDEAFDAYSSKVLYRCIDAELKWDPQVDLSACYETLNQLEDTVATFCSEIKEPHERLDKLLDTFYQHWLFSVSSLKVPEYTLNSFRYTITMRSGTQTTLAILLCHLIQHAELDASVTLSQGEVHVHVGISDEEGYLIEPSTGQQSWYITPENACEENGDEQEPLELVFDEELYKLYLAQQKWSFISESKFGHALHCVEMLMELLGDDPYERRDRGYLLNQLDCPKMARDDLQYFVNECPDDPAIEIIQHQIAEIEDNNNTHH
ncbi:tetratricopeptide repeat protein [Pseudoalteromonas sp. SSMSWG5]|jgi:regulator of sirC expression with transglutaminase-like and TPR domain|uniref:tetratricopeptide repeat protein n=1 Tax=Pseudoalteromonas TaxID=53246 RepID=UPI000EC6E6EF|nr:MULTISPECIES: tetratricopeptide repeat protein [unclassified Pseudoalteromonas]HCV05395.1 transcriptional regulator [Pseudoalteromonas sp.]MCF2900989.1 tetratricopeptide repeat protein [Pseudoalteromonas sp. OFAV1]MCF2920496.1 tetratricopeptide repeat protein [Pseudoalteromonas sp. APAL1]MCO7250630.1 tetratricopeptide repeat protein [Pseudoalteromonas sp. Ps84H-4]TGV20193.1 tetratricopeptide repeat protein [Pseudoalteromonas sp. MEBiC 03607]|tara:strand:+ start:105 stop:932 length:828 start_codon:yes stop_codon:yes gene_type:complete